MLTAGLVATILPSHRIQLLLNLLHLLQLYINKMLLVYRGSFLTGLVVLEISRLLTLYNLREVNEHAGRCEEEGASNAPLHQGSSSAF